jgi:hypothetical protein
MFKTIMLAATASAILVGCGMPSGVVPVGPDSYMTSATALGVIGSAAPMGAAREASRYCEQQGRHMIIRNTQNTTLSAGPTTSTLVFSCVTDTDPEYHRPTLRNDIGVVTATH